MNWIAVGAVAEVLGAMGVILSLIYVALPVQHGTAEARQDTAIRVMEASVSVTKPLTGSREYSATYSSRHSKEKSYRIRVTDCMFTRGCLLR